MPKEPKNKIINGMKKCNICGENKPTSEYYPYRKSIRGGCKRCAYKKNKSLRLAWSPERKLEYSRRSMDTKEKRRKKYSTQKKRLLRYKQEGVDYLGGSCSKCGYNKCIEALEFHHKVPGEKVKTGNGGAIDRRRTFKANKSELDKCILLCANCHRETHYEHGR